MKDQVPTRSIASSENYEVWISEEDGETLYHLELNSVTLHFFREEWEELIALLEEAAKQ
ncbi:MAG: hypothetical protein MUF87_13765 [Anaerolineae bacterium]|jgi:hypothetical protein|nr:hypothetical protein [Anaerolineae bacterium]